MIHQKTNSIGYPRNEKYKVAGFWLRAADTMYIFSLVRPYIYTFIVELLFRHQERLLVPRLLLCVAATLLLQEASESSRGP